MGELSSGSEKCGIMKMAARASGRLVRRTKDGGEQREPRKSGARERASERAVLPRRVNKQGQTTKNQPTNQPFGSFVARRRMLGCKDAPSVHPAQCVCPAELLTEGHICTMKRLFTRSGILIFSLFHLHTCPLGSPAELVCLALWIAAKGEFPLFMCITNEGHYYPDEYVTTQCTPN